MNQNFKRILWGVKSVIGHGFLDFGETIKQKKTYNLTARQRESFITEKLTKLLTLLPLELLLLELNV